MNTGLLIAEPDAELRRIYSRLSSVLGFHVETAADGLECWTKLRALSPDALVIDAEIPWGGGDGVLACLREHDSRGAGAPTVYVMGDDPPEALSSRFDIPAGQCFQKPLQLAALFDSVCNGISAGSSQCAPRGDSPVLAHSIQTHCV
jgi:CheY-like chemotaxis protein